MSIFRYRMQNILELKLKLEEQAKMRYAQQRKALNDAEELERSLERQKDFYKEEAAALRLDKLNIQDIRDNEANIRIMDERIAEQKKVVVLEERELELRRQMLDTVMKERKAQEKLRENAFQQFLQDENAAESKQIDELTSYTYGARKRGEGS